MAIIATDGRAGGIGISMARFCRFLSMVLSPASGFNLRWLFSFPYGFFYASYWLFFLLFRPGRIKV